MKEVLNKNRPIIIMECENDNCLCKFKTDEYTRYRSWLFNENWCYKDTCPECWKKVYNLNIKNWLA